MRFHRFAVLCGLFVVLGGGLVSGCSDEPAPAYKTLGEAGSFRVHLVSSDWDFVVFSAIEADRDSREVFVYEVGEERTHRLGRGTLGRFEATEFPDEYGFSYVITEPGGLPELRVWPPSDVYGETLAKDVSMRSFFDEQGINFGLKPGSVSEDRAWYYWDRETGEEHRLASTGSLASADHLLSEDRRRILLRENPTDTSGAGLVLWDSSTKQAEVIYRGQYQVGDFGFTGDGTHVYYKRLTGGDSSELHLWRIADQHDSLLATSASVITDDRHQEASRLVWTERRPGPDGLDQYSLHAWESDSQTVRTVSDDVEGYEGQIELWADARLLRYRAVTERDSSRVNMRWALYDLEADQEYFGDFVQTGHEWVRGVPAVLYSTTIDEETSERRLWHADAADSVKLFNSGHWESVSADGSFGVFVDSSGTGEAAIRRVRFPELTLETVAEVQPDTSVLDFEDERFLYRVGNPWLSEGFTYWLKDGADAEPQPVFTIPEGAFDVDLNYAPRFDQGFAHYLTGDTFEPTTHLRTWKAGSDAGQVDLLAAPESLISDDWTYLFYVTSLSDDGVGVLNRWSFDAQEHVELVGDVAPKTMDHSPGFETVVARRFVDDECVERCERHGPCDAACTGTLVAIDHALAPESPQVVEVDEDVSHVLAVGNGVVLYVTATSDNASRELRLRKLR